MNIEQKNFFDDFDVIDAYSRTEAIADGLLFDLSSTAREAGVPYPVAVTYGVYADCIGVSTQDSVVDENERVMDLLLTVSAFVRMAKGEHVVMFEMPVFDDACECQPINLKLVCGPGDMGEPVLTIMKPDED